ncbi:heme ABC exporter ATP-binding protein CcmA [Pseudorhizobium pelagicum]|uniref:Cytochrome C biogenesis protein n=1 Tax=Pseudorhizobium pelagicum TaxID=1509405 RepID=A0A922P288_9HYPH|nr:heme ABC exporter ATP-binding protein CcmA [Pseudorhizobium pelagicum]KEQ07069.1 cytochrome C biogenesis protein [Pseudorhizobium pelagicum]KEQ10014.1 cytochrome C biogenesis protein [Pseudorhizobium pelagicum]
MRLRAERLGARRGEDLLFSDISFDLGSGDALVLTGRNGSGKSTLLRVVAGLLPAEAGRVLWTGKDETVRAGEACHYLGHRNAMKAELTVRENLVFWKSFLGDLEGGAGMSVVEAADRVGLGGIAHLPFGYLSAGQQRRMAFAKLLVAYRPVWILDEPTAALDTRAEQTFTDLIKQHLAAGGMLLAATHQPLGLENARELRMTGFSDLPEAFLQ